MGERGGGRRGDLGRGGRRDIFPLDKKKQRESRWECARVCEAKGRRCSRSLSEWGRVWEDAGAGLWTSLNWEGKKLEPLPTPSRVRSCGLATRRGLSSGSRRWERVRSVRASLRWEHRPNGAERGALGALGLLVPAGSGCWAWGGGGGEEERRISAPNSICWRTWPAPRQAENSTYVRTCTQCWLRPRRAFPSCCAPRSAPALRLPPPAPRSPHVSPHGDQV